jgi:hypothetical protein
MIDLHMGLEMIDLHMGLEVILAIEVLAIFAVNSWWKFFYCWGRSFNLDGCVQIPLLQSICLYI